MKFNVVFIFSLIFHLSVSLFPQSTYFIKYKNNVSFNTVDSNIRDQRLTSSIAFRPSTLPEYNINYLAKGLAKEDEVLGRIVKVQFANDLDESTLNSLLQSDPDVDYIQKANTYKLDFTPNDSLVSEQWALQTIQAYTAWDITTGSDTVLLAIVDTGMDYDHPDLKNKIFINPGETGLDNLGRDKKSNGVDDDANGFIDDYRGWDFTDRVGFPFDSSGGDYLTWDNNPYDDQGHGTFIAGIAAAETDNLYGIAGAAPNIKMLNIRAFDPGGFGEEDDVAAAILYAVKQGSKVINMSFGDYTFSYVLRDVIRFAYSKNVVLIASAGNTGSNEPHYPSGYSEVICVGNSTRQDFVASNSNFGSTIDLVAPGTEIITTARLSGYALVSGTSASAPFVSAAASLILSQQYFTNEEVKQILKTTTDDIGEPGWDLRSGAGRLNLNKALTVLAPAIVKFNSPVMDYSTNDNNILVNATVLSPYFLNYKLEVGSGFNPDSWNSLIVNSQNQISNTDIYDIDVSGYAEGIYTLRLVVLQNNGRTIEERINFYILRTPPKVTEVGLGPIYYGDKSTIAGEFYTNQPSIMRLFYRNYGEQEFSYITLDGFNTNNQFVKQFHYGFIPKEIVQPSQLYEVYFEAENLAGLKTTVLDSTNNLSYYLFRTEDPSDLRDVQLMPFSMPNGNLFKDPVSFTSNSYNEIFFQLFYTSTESYFGLYELDNNQFVKLDSLQGKFPRIFGDFNSNGRKDLLSYKFPDVKIDEQTAQNSFSFSEKYSNQNLFDPLTVEDLNNDGKYEIISNSDNTKYKIWQIDENLNVGSAPVFEISNTYNDQNDPDLNLPTMNELYRNLVVTDSDNDGIKEIWFVDADGDIIQYVVNSLTNILKGDSLRVAGLTTNKDNIFTTGDYDGDGKDEFCILYNTNSIAPTYLLLILNFENGQPNILTQKVFLDQSAEYVGGITFRDAFQSLKFIDVDNDQKAELVLNIFPYAYVLKRENNEDKIIYFTEGANTFRIFEGDLNQNGLKEVGLRIDNSYTFLEFAFTERPQVPFNITGYSVSNSLAYISWQGSSDQYYVYKGTSSDSLILYDSTFQSIEYFDANVDSNLIYYYSIQSYDPIKQNPFSLLSSAVPIYVHTPAEVISVQAINQKNVIVKFSEKIKTTIENLQSFQVMNSGYPNSISPNDQYSYLLSFNDNLPDGDNVLIVNHLRDYYNSPIQPGTINFRVNPVPDLYEFYITSYQIMDPYNIKITFNFQIDETSALDVTNYKFDPDNKVSSVRIDQNDKKIIYLNMDNQKPVGSVGKEYVLRLENLYSDASTGNIKIKEGAGSYIVLSTYAKDLSDVYVYPNPVSEGETKITFANLPQRVKITIWSISGKRINEIEENNGDGGVEFNLKDEDGKSIGSGVYIYRVVLIDDLNNEGEEKMGKFAVVR